VAGVMSKTVFLVGMGLGSYPHASLLRVCSNYWPRCVAGYLCRYPNTPVGGHPLWCTRQAN
jgi:hypothetical protein